MKKLFRALINSSVVYFLAGMIVLGSTCDTARVVSNRLNYLKESANYPVKYVEGKDAFDKRQFYYARYYYENLLKTIPLYEKQGLLNADVTSARAWAMIAICQYYLGHYPQAVKAMKKAAVQEPRQFWFQYDLGLMYFLLGNGHDAFYQARDLIPFSKEKLEASMQLDYYEQWPPAMAAEYRKASLQNYYQFLLRSYKLAVLAADRIRDEDSVRTFALSAIRSGLANNDKSFYYYAGLVQDKPAGDSLPKFMFPTSVYFVPIGQEKLAIMKR